MDTSICAVEFPILYPWVHHPSLQIIKQLLHILKHRYTAHRMNAIRCGCVLIGGQRNLSGDQWIA